MEHTKLRSFLHSSLTFLLVKYLYGLSLKPGWSFSSQAASCWWRTCASSWSRAAGSQSTDLPGSSRYPSIGVHSMIWECSQKLPSQTMCVLGMAFRRRGNNNYSEAQITERIGIFLAFEAMEEDMWDWERSLDGCLSGPVFLSHWVVSGFHTSI